MMMMMMRRRRRMLLLLMMMIMIMLITMACFRSRGPGARTGRRDVHRSDKRLEGLNLAGVIQCVRTFISFAKSCRMVPHV
jgi:hypothetical protein